MPTISKAWVIFNFKIHQDYIAKVLCINRNKPKSTCNGKCHLNKQLEKTNEKEEKQTPVSLKLKADFIFLPSQNIFIKPIVKNNKNGVNLNFTKNLNSSQYTNSLFRPPEFISLKDYSFYISIDY